MGNTEVSDRQSDGDQKANEDLHGMNDWPAGFPIEEPPFPVINH